MRTAKTSETGTAKAGPMKKGIPRIPIVRNVPKVLLIHNVIAKRQMRFEFGRKASTAGQTKRAPIILPKNANSVTTGRAIARKPIDGSKPQTAAVAFRKPPTNATQKAISVRFINSIQSPNRILLIAQPPLQHTSKRLPSHFASVVPCRSHRQ